MPIPTINPMAQPSMARPVFSGVNSASQMQTQGNIFNRLKTGMRRPQSKLPPVRLPTSPFTPSNINSLATSAVKPVSPSMNAPVLSPSDLTTPITSFDQLNKQRAAQDAANRANVLESQRVADLQRNAP